MQTILSKKAGIVLGILIAAGVVYGALRYVPVSYNPVIDPAKFTTVITNRYATLPVGTVRVYEGPSTAGPERVEITIPGETRDIMGVRTLLYRDKVWVNGALIEDTRDYIAQDADGNVWYFGEEVNNYKNGVIEDHAGSWIAGVDGAKPGYWVKAVMNVGDSYRQEYYKGKAEDMVDVIAVGQTVTIPQGTYKDCVKTYDWTPLDPESKEYKYYCPAAGGLTVEEDPANGERLELTSKVR